MGQKTASLRDKIAGGGRAEARGFVTNHAAVKSSLVFVRKKKVGEKLGKYKIFMAIADHIGYDARGNNEPRNELPMIVEKYHAFKK
ncbi:MAG: hypothetical protein CMI56_03055 [Parcubacteria group bacterium]|nr:hypothetical protein [Parcubacteria group bacterium]|tara:strand:+ start:2423 stop:2680 length:258 start_codon:yes stop_codon:yes gene_type:complete